MARRDPRTEGDAVGARRDLQRPEHAGFVQIAVVVGRIGRTPLFNQHPPQVGSNLLPGPCIYVGKDRLRDVEEALEAARISP